MDGFGAAFTAGPESFVGEDSVVWYGISAFDASMPPSGEKYSTYVRSSRDGRVLFFSLDGGRDMPLQYKPRADFGRAESVQ